MPARCEVVVLVIRWKYWGAQEGLALVCPEESHDKGSPAGRLLTIKLPFELPAWRSGFQPLPTLGLLLGSGSNASVTCRSAADGDQ